MIRILCSAAVLVSLSLSRDADARVVMRRPSVADSCPGSPTWSATQKCIERFGTTTLLRSQGDVRLVQLRAREGDFNISGVYLYVQSGKRWHIGGAYVDRKPMVIGFSTPTYDGRRAFRIDVVYAANEHVMVDEVSARNAFVRHKTAVFCSGQSSGCTQILTACDVFVAGKSYATFRATLAYEGGGLMTVAGDRSRAGDHCQQLEETHIPVPELSFDFGLD